MVKKRNIRYVVYTAVIVLLYLISVFIYGEKTVYINSMYINGWKVCFYFLQLFIGLLCTADFPLQKGAGKGLCAITKIAGAGGIIVITVIFGSHWLIGLLLLGIQCGSMVSVLWRCR